MEKQENCVAILVVDDEEAIRDLVVAILDPPCQVITATDGEDALSRLEADLFDVVLIDLWMPIMDGAELVRHVRADPRTRHIPIIIFTAIDQFPTSIARSDVQAFLPKPFTVANLLRTIERVLSNLPHSPLIAA